MIIDKDIQVISETEIQMIVTMRDDERVRSTRVYHLVKSPTQNTEDVCRTACPEAFAEAFAS